VQAAPDGQCQVIRAELLEHEALGIERRSQFLGTPHPYETDLGVEYERRKALFGEQLRALE
jgi:hypothetical protein